MPQHYRTSVSHKSKKSVKEQLVLFGDSKPAVINVSSVPQRSPFRYPGGKTWLIPYIRKWLTYISAEKLQLLEPFAGGAIVTLSAVAEKRVRQGIMVELDEDVASVWQTILGEDAQWLANKIFTFDMTSENLKKQLSKKIITTRDQAFVTILKNRVNHGGILANGAGILKNGENGKGILSRWYPDTLKRRILDIQNYKSKIKFICGDAFPILDKYKSNENVISFIDPPYTVAGRRLYRYSVLNHSELFNKASELRGDFLITYDNAPEIRDLARQYGFNVAEVPMKGTTLSEKTELLIGKDLKWLKL